LWDRGYEVASDAINETAAFVDRNVGSWEGVANVAGGVSTWAGRGPVVVDAVSLVVGSGGTIAIALSVTATAGGGLQWMQAPKRTANRTFGAALFSVLWGATTLGTWQATSQGFAFASDAFRLFLGEFVSAVCS
jgi:hypothetical protein